MKVGVLTYHRAVNYGAVVQAYALTQQLAKRFPQHQFEVVDFSYKYTMNEQKINLLKALLKFGPKRYASLRKEYSNFSAGVDVLPLGKRYITNNYSDVMCAVSKEYDLVIVGSDAVFNWKSAPIPNIYFFNTDKCIHVSYAASVHLNRYYDINAHQKEYLEEALSRFAYIGTRDQETEKFVHYVNKELKCSHNCDPTVVLDLNFDTPDLDEKMKKYGISKDDKVICLMLKSKEYGRIVRERYGDNYKIIAVRRNNPYADVYIPDLSPLEWAKVFGYADFTLTDFFHGSLLSLKNGTPVLSIDSSGYTGQYESKAKDLFITRLNFPEMFHEKNANDEQEVADKIDYLLHHFEQSKIPEALNNEARSFDSFCNEIELILGK